MADVFAPQPIKTKTNGDAVVKLVDFTVNTQGLAIDASGRLAIVPNLAVNNAQVSGTTTSVNNGVTDAGTTRVTLSSDSTGQVKLATGANIIGSLAANQSVNNAQVSGTAIDVNTGNASAGTMRVVLATNQPVVSVTQGNSGTVTDTYGTSTALASGATATLDSANVTSGTGHLTEATVSSSVALKAQIGTWDGTTFIVFRTFFCPANGSITYTPSRSDAITKATGATAKFRWSITNNDNINAADVYASTTYWYA